MSLTVEERKNYLNQLRNKVGEYPDFPKPGINFKDIFTALRDGETCVVLKRLIVDYVLSHHPQIDAVVGLDARGFLFSFMIASELSIGCVPVRKRGKLPGETISVEYKLEYGTDVFEIQAEAIKKGQRILLIDDLIATGGSLKAAVELVEKSGGIVDGCLIIMELTSLKGRDNLSGIPIHSFLQYDDVE